MIHDAYRTLAKKRHPDVIHDDGVQFKELNEAHEVLMDDKKRIEYDGFWRNPSDLSYSKRDIGDAHGNPHQLAVIAFSNSDDEIRSQAVRPLVESGELAICLRVATSSFDETIVTAARKKVVQTKLGNLGTTNDYANAIGLARSNTEPSYVRGAAVLALTTLLGQAIGSGTVTNQMIKDYMIHLVCGKLKRDFRPGEEQTESNIPIDTRVAFGEGIRTFYEQCEKSEELFKLENTYATYLPNALRGKFFESAIRVYTKNNNLDGLIDILEGHGLRNAEVTQVVDGVMAIAARDASSDSFQQTMRTALDKSGGYRFGDCEALQLLIVRLIENAVERNDKECIAIVERTGQNLLRFERQPLPYRIDSALDTALRAMQAKAVSDVTPATARADAAGFDRMAGGNGRPRPPPTRKCFA